MSYTGLVERNRALADEIEARHISGVVSASDDVANRIVAGLREANDAIEALTRPVDVEAVARKVVEHFASDTRDGNAPATAIAFPAFGMLITCLN